MLKITESAVCHCHDLFVLLEWATRIHLGENSEIFIGARFGQIVVHL